MKNSKIPGTYKSTATFEVKTLENPVKRPRVANDIDVKDNDYSYTTTEFPGFMGQDANLDRAERMHKKTK